MHSPGAYRRALLFGVLAHVATGVYSFVAKPVTVAFGSVGGGFAVYSLTLALLLVWYLGSRQLRKELSAWRSIVISAKLGRALLLTLFCYSLGAVCFYQGLITSQNVALYAILLGNNAPPWPQVAQICALIKFGLILAGLLYVIAGVVGRVVRRAE